MDKKLLYGVMTAQLLIMGATQYHNNDVVSRKVAEINKQDEIIAEFKEIDKLQEQEFERMNSQINETNLKLAENERIKNEQIQIVESQKVAISEQQKVIDSLRAELQQAKQPQVQAVKTDGRVLQMEASAYTNHPSENGTYGGRVVTRSGYDITNTIRYNGMGIVASDPNVIPMGSIITIEGLQGRYIVLDTGGAIKGNKLDVLMGSTSETSRWGRRSVKVTILERG